MARVWELPVDYTKLTQAQRREVRLQYIARQSHACAHCKHDLRSDPAPHIQEQWINLDLFPRNFLSHPVHLHHSHDTGLTIGAVHARCNAILWQYHGK